MIKSNIIDGTGSKSAVKVNGDHALYTIDVPHPPLGVQKTRPFRQYMTTDGTVSGSNNIGVDGSSTNVDFYIPASSTDDRYIKELSIIIGYGTTGKPYQFADSTALTNGFRLFYTSDKGEVDIDDAIKTNSELLRLSNDNVILSDWEIRHLAANNDYGYLISIDLDVFSPSLGIKLDRGTNQRLVFRVRDNATNADEMNIQAFGFDRFE